MEKIDFRDSPFISDNEISQFIKKLPQIGRCLKNLNLECKLGKYGDLGTIAVIVNTCLGLEELNLSVRAYNCLKRAQVNSVSDLMGFSYEDLLEIKNFGSKSADEVIEALERIGIQIPQSRTSV